MLLLQSIKAATEQTMCGDRVSEELLDAADDLYHQRIPHKWSQLGGDSSPPPTWSLAAWFTDLGNRFSHIDRIIVQVKRFPDVVDKNPGCHQRSHKRFSHALLKKPLAALSKH